MLQGSGWRQRMQRRVSRRRVLRAGLLGTAGTIAYVAVGCGEDGGSASIPRPQSGGPVKRGGTYRLALTGDPPTLDPYKNNSFQTQERAAAVYSRLFKFKSGPDVDYAAFIPEPDVAQEYEIPDDGLTLTIRLKQNVMVHPTPPLQGRQFTAEDVRVSFDRFRAVSQLAPDFAFVDRVDVPDDLTVVFRLKEPFAPIINLLASPQHFWLLPKEADDAFDPAQVMIGTGPWQFVAYNPSQNFQVKRFDQWHGAGEENLPYLDAVNYSIIPEYATRLVQFQGGNLDAIGVNANDLVDLQSRLQGAVFEGNFRALMSFLYMNGPSQAGVLASDSPFRDERVRRALSMAINRDEMTDLVYNVSALRAAGIEAPIRWNAVFMPVGMGRYWLDPQSDDMGDAAEYYQYKVQDAKQLLQAAGFDMSQEIPLRTVRNVYGSDFDDSADLLLSYLKELGLKVTLTVEDYRGQYITATSRGQFSGLAYGYETPFTEPGDYLRRNFTPNDKNRSRVDDSRLTDLVRRSDREFDLEERVRLIHEVIRYASDKMYYVAGQAGANEEWVAYGGHVRNAAEYATSGYGGATETLPYVWLDR